MSLPVATALIGAVLLACASASGFGGHPPNFVILLADDLGYEDVSLFGSPSIYTPHIDRLGREGSILKQAYASASVCTPSRSGIMTGRVAARDGIYTDILRPQLRGFFSFSDGGLPNRTTLPAVLKKAPKPYRSKLVGKWHLGHKHSLPTQRGWDEFYGIPYSNDMDAVTGGFADVPILNRVIPPIPLYHNEEIIEQPASFDTLTDQMTEQGIDFLQARQQDSDPFLLMMTYYQPHVPQHPAPRFRNTSLRGIYGDSVQEMDASVGRILDTLDQLNLTQNTVVLFSSDNGPWVQEQTHGGSPGPFAGGKGTTWEGGLRVPTMVRWPAHVPVASINYNVFSHLDIVPTFAELAGVKQDAVPLDLDGTSFAQQLVNTTYEDANKSVIYMYGRTVMALRRGRYKLHRFTRCAYCDEPPQAAEPPLVFDLLVDPGEKMALNVSAHAVLVDSLLAEYQRVVDGLANIPDPELQKLDMLAGPCCSTQPWDKPCYTNATNSTPTGERSAAHWISSRPQTLSDVIGMTSSVATSLGWDANEVIPRAFARFVALWERETQAADQA